MEQRIKWPKSIERSRHRLLLLYATLSSFFAMVGYYVMNFDRLHAVAYAATAYVVLNALNYRSVLKRIEHR